MAEKSDRKKKKGSSSSGDKPAKKDAGSARKTKASKAPSDKKAPAPRKKSPPREEEGPPEERPVIQPGSGRRFLLGCCLPALLFILLLITIALPAVWCVLRVKAPRYIPQMFSDAVHLLRYASSTFYRLTEKGCELAGGKEDPLTRAQDSLFARVETGGTDGKPPTVWQIAAYRARRTGGGAPPEEIVFQDRTAFLRTLRERGEYRDDLRFLTATLYKGGKPFRIRMCPAEHGTWLFDCRFVPSKRSMIPWAGWRLNEEPGPGLSGERAELYLAGVRIFDRAFSASCALRGEEGLLKIKPEERMFYQYAFCGNGERLRAAVRSGNRGSMNELLLKKRLIFGPGGAGLFPDPLIRMAVWNSDLTLLDMLLRNEAALSEITGEATGPASFTTLHAAAMQPDPRALAKIIALYPDAHPAEPLSGATPFLAAVMADRTENVLLFLRRKEPGLWKTLPDGSSALHLAVLNLSPDIVRMLLLHGADRSCRNKAGETPAALLKRIVRENGLEGDPDAEALKLLLP